MIESFDYKYYLLDRKMLSLLILISNDSKIYATISFKIEY